MDSTSTPKATEPDDAPIARADERLAHAYEQITRADEKLAQLSEQVAKMERDTAPRPPFSVERPPSTTERPPSVEFGPPSPPRRPALRTLVGLALAACIIVAALVLQSSYGGRPGWLPVGSRSPFQLHCPRIIRRLPHSPLHPPFNWLPQIQQYRNQRPWRRPHHNKTRRRRPRRRASRSEPSCCKRWRATWRSWQRTVEQLKASQQQMAGDNAKAIEQLKASQEELKRTLAKVSEQNVSKASPPPTQPVATLRRLGRMVQAPRPETPAASNLLEGVDLRRLRLVIIDAVNIEALPTRRTLSLHNTSAASPAVS